MKSLKSMGEFGLIEQIQKMVRNHDEVRVGIGDDTAVVRVKKGKDLLFTTDMLIEGRHFKLKDAMPFEIGRKALAVNLSDIAAMAGVPTHAVVALGIPASRGLGFVKALYRGMETLARRFGVSIVGGDTNASDRLVISIAMIGEVSAQAVVKRSGARPGDLIFVTNSLGGSYRSKKHLRFVPRLKEARFLVRNFKIHSMMDISDGLASDIRRIAEASHVGALLFESSIPVSRAARNVRQALMEGEDFELLFTLSPKEAGRLGRHPLSGKIARFTCVGRILSEGYGVRIRDSKGRLRPLAEKGYEHFK